MAAATGSSVYRFVSYTGVLDRLQRCLSCLGRDAVAKIGPSADEVRKIGVGSDFVVAHLRLDQKHDRMP
jgi:hypothetical protein